MRKFLPFFVLALILSISYSTMTLAVCVEGPVDTFTCDTNPPNPDPTGVQQNGNNNDLTVNVLPGAGIDTILANGGNGGNAIQTDDGNDRVTITDATVFGELTAVTLSRGDDTVDISGSTLSAVVSAVVRTSFDNDTINIVNSTLIKSRLGGSNPVESGDGDDVINITGSTLDSVNDTVAAGSGNDRVTIIDSTLLSRPDGSRTTIQLGDGDDILTLGTGAELLNGPINCSNDFDTIIFAMDVPEDLLNRFSLEILRADPAGDTIEINGLTYTWESCELLVNDLNGVPIEPRPIPTLSQWGMIAMAGVIGIVGVLFVVRRRNKVVA